ncbi:hypothetical protein AYO47_08450 [Planctomyces sp. SCGC AG-212-M04]|nr:hypothetical protein AYO47_08450 [Planctomyces sp. SCGC AG-212-M04]
MVQGDRIMLSRLSPRIATTLGALVAMTVQAAAADQIDKAWASGSPVQYGELHSLTPPNRMPNPSAPTPQVAPMQLGGGAQLLNEASGDVHFLVDGQDHTLKAGDKLDLPAGQHLVEFNTGGQYGDIRFTVSQGTYKFKVMPEGWALFRSSSQGSVAGAAPSTGARAPMQRGSFTPPLPAEDLRTRRVAGRTDANAATPGQLVSPPAAGTSQNAAPTVASPPPPGVVRPRATTPQPPAAQPPAPRTP